MKVRFLRLSLAIVFAVLSLTGGALADAIDGNWCAPDGRIIVIEGANITTPSGTQLQGNYARHFFSYVSPEEEPDAGATVDMTLVNEETVHLRVGAAATGYEVWHRCDVTS